MKFSLLKILIMTIVVSYGIAQPEVLWTNTYGGTSTDKIEALIESSDGGFLMTGYTASTGNGGYDLWIVKTDSIGTEIWAQTYGGGSADYGYSILELDGGDILVAGITGSFGAGYSDAWLLRTDASGNEIWNRTFGGVNQDFGKKVILTNDGGFAILGATNGSGSGDYDMWLIKTDSDGVEEWSTTYGGFSIENAYDLIQTSDGGYAILGSTSSFGDYSYDAWLIKTYPNESGTEWEVKVGGAGNEGGYSILEDSNNNLVFVGLTTTTDNGVADALIAKFSLSGSEIWQKSLGDELFQKTFSVSESPIGTYFISGYTQSAEYGDQFWCMDVDTAGIERWSGTYGGGSSDISYASLVCADGSYALAGITQSYGSGSDDGWLIKLSNYSATFHVSSAGSDSNPGSEAAPFATIQAAIDYSLAGDTVLVQPGTYVENINFNGKNIVVGSLFLTTQDTSYISQTVIDGNQSGSVVRFENGETETAKIVGFTIQNGLNTDGGGILCSVSSPILENLIIRNCSAGGGAGVALINSNAILLNCYIVDNIGGNSGAILGYGGSPTITNTLIANNSGSFGSAIKLDGCNLTVMHSTIVNNSANGVYGMSNSALIMINSILYGNGVSSDDQILNYGLSRQISYSLVQGGSQGNGNFDSQPLFTDPGTKDFTLTDYSPCIGAGLDTTFIPETDINGNPRPNPAGSNPDIGAYENPFGTPQHMPITINIPDDFATIQAGLNAADSTDTVLVQPGTYTENLFWPETNGITLLSAGDSSNTIIDGGGASSVIYMNGLNVSIDSSTIIQGFKITNGGGVTNGGGLLLNSVSPLLKELLISSNHASGSGGGAYLLSGSPVLTNSAVSLNTASEGGGIYILDETMDHGSSVEIPIVSNTLISNNTSSSNGGGVCLYLSNAVLTNSVIRENQSSNGGGIRIDGFNTHPSINNCTIIENNAQNGGGMHLTFATRPDITNSIIIQNTASVEGGGIWMQQSEPNLVNSTFSNNSAGSNGGGMYVFLYSIPTFNAVDFHYNSASMGGAIYILNNSSPLLESLSATGNTSEVGGAIYIESGNPIVTNSNLINNEVSVFNYDNAFITQATNNYWGDNSGPYHPSQNPTGLGDSTNAFVNVTPWLTIPNIDAPPIPAQNVSVSGTGNDFVNLEWDQSPLGDFAGFKLYYDTDESGYPYDNSVDVGSNTSHTLSGLNLGTEYFLAVTVYDTDGNESWYSQEVTGTTRVMEAQNLDIAGDEELFHLVTHNPLITFDYFDSMGEAQTNYQIQISTDSTFQSNLIWDTGEVSSHATSVQYTDGLLENGISYYLRAKVASGAFWSDWSTLTFRMNSEPILPIQVSLIANEVTTDDVVLEIMNSSDAENDNLTYDFRLYDATQTTQLDSAIAVTEVPEGTIWEVTTALDDNAQHWWTVQAYDGYEYSEIAGPASFLINFENDIPESFSTLFPNADEAIALLQPQLVWEPAFDPDPLDTVRYVLYLDTPNPGVELFDVGTDTMFQIVTELQDNTTYFWKVIAHDLNGASTECLGGYQSFRVNTSNDLPTPFQLLAPVSGAMVTTLTPEFLWEQSSDPDDQPLLRGIPGGKRSNELIQGSNDHIMVITGYDLFLGTNPDLTAVEPIFVAGNSYIPVNPLVENTMYYWAAIAHDDSGGSISSDTTSFWTNAVNSSPSGFSLITPVGNQTVGTIHPTFSWEMAEDEDLFDEVVYNIYMGTSIEEMEWVYTGLLPFIMDTVFTLIEPIEDNTIYYWSVEARDNQGATTNNMEGFQSFNVNLGNEDPSIVDLIAPDSVMILTLTPEMYWIPAFDPDPNDIVHYEIHWWGDGVEYDSVVTDTNAVVIPYELEDNSQYYWEVIAMDQTDGISHSEETTFWIDLFDEAPVGFALLTPEDNASGLSPRPSFLWEMAEDPDPFDYAVYMFQVATDSAFVDMVFQTPTAATVGYEMVEDLLNDTEYWWRVIATDRDSLSTVSETFKFTVGYVSVAEDIALPTEYVLQQNYPNPFNPTTTLRYGLPEESEVSLTIFDIRGKLVKSHTSGTQNAGWHEQMWNGLNEDGELVSTGIYLARLQAGSYSKTIKMLYLK